MEYFDSGQFHDFSVQDIFESEVKSEIDELLSTETTPFAQETVTNMDLGTALSSQDMGLEITELQAWSDALGSINEAESLCSPTKHSVEYSGSSDKYGFDSFSGQNNILVDPQTGLPTSLSQTTVGGTHIHAQQVNLFVNSASSQLQQQALLQQQQGLNNISNNIRPTGLGLEQFNHTNLNSNVVVSNSHIHARPVQPANVRQFAHYQLQNGQSLPVVSQPKISKSSHKCAGHQSIIKAAKHHPYTAVKPHSKKHSKGNKTIKLESGLIKAEKVWAKPCYSYSCLITMALKNSKAGCLPVSEIYHFMCENFPYFKTAKDGWKNSVRHNLSLNKCFAKVENAVSNAKSGKKGCLWAMNPEKFAKMEEEVHKSTERDPVGIRMCMAKPEDFPKIEALSRLTHPKNLKNAAKIRESINAVSKKPAYHVSSMISVKSEKVKAPTVTMATVPARVPTPVSLKKIDVSSFDLFQQDLNALESATFLPLDMEASLQNSHNDVFSYDTVEIIPCNPRTTLSRSASSMSDISPYKDSSQSVNSRILGLDKSPITTLAHTHYSGLEQASRRLEAFL